MQFMIDAMRVAEYDFVALGLVVPLRLLVVRKPQRALAGHISNSVSLDPLWVSRAPCPPRTQQCHTDHENRHKNNPRKALYEAGWLRTTISHAFLVFILISVYLGSCVVPLLCEFQI
jgi:hypothetical protein